MKTSLFKKKRRGKVSDTPFDEEEVECNPSASEGASAKDQKKNRIQIFNQQLKNLQQEAAKRTHETLEKAAALGVDDNFKYDEGFEEFSSESALKQRRLAAVNDSKDGKKSIYIDRLLESARHREIQQEISREKANRREIEEENEIIGAPSEVFVTGAYKEKLMEQKKWEANEIEKEKSSQKSTSGMNNLHGHLLSLLAGDDKNSCADNAVCGRENVMDKTCEASQKEDEKHGSVKSSVLLEKVSSIDFQDSDKTAKAVGFTDKRLHEEAQNTEGEQATGFTVIAASELESARIRAIERARSRGALFLKNIDLS